MCIKSEFPISENKDLTIHEDCSVTLRSWELDEELGGPDIDTIPLSQDEARKVARILTEELG